MRFLLLFEVSGKRFYMFTVLLLLLPICLALPSSNIVIIEYTHKQTSQRKRYQYPRYIHSSRQVKSSQLMPNPLFKHRDRLDLIEIIQRLQRHVLSEEHIPLDPVWQERVELIAGVSRGGNGKDVVELFERSLFRFCFGPRISFLCFPLTA